MSSNNSNFCLFCVLAVIRKRTDSGDHCAAPVPVSRWLDTSYFRAHAIFKQVCGMCYTSDCSSLFRNHLTDLHVAYLNVSFLMKSAVLSERLGLILSSHQVCSYLFLCTGWLDYQFADSHFCPPPLSKIQNTIYLAVLSDKKTNVRCKCPSQNIPVTNSASTEQESRTVA